MINIPLPMSYAEFAFLRDLVSKEQHKIWHSRFAKKIRKGYDPADAFREIMDYDPKVDDIELKPPLGDIKCCAYLLHRFQKIEAEIQKQMQG